MLSAGSGQYYSNRLGLRGKEDLDNGLNAHFQLESGVNSKTGALGNTNKLLFNCTAAVGVGGAWGSLDLGRQYTIGFRTELFLDPFNHHYTGLVPLSSGSGTSLPAAATAAGLGAFDGLTVRAEYAPGEVAGDSGKGSARAVELTGAVYRSSYEGAAATGTRTLYLLGGSSHFSKRTNLHGEFDLNRYRGALIPASKQTGQRGIGMGVMHMF